MKTMMLPRLLGSRPQPESFQAFDQKPDLNQILSFIRSAAPRQLRAIRLAMVGRREWITYEVTYKSGRTEDWMVGSTDEMISIVGGKTRSITNISRGKETIK